MKILGIIPARYASTRFPGKPLVEIQGKSMIQRVYEQAKKALEEVIVATDDERIYEHVKAFGGKVTYTDAAHQSGTDRCAEVVKQFPEFEVIINIQGDEPFIQPEQIQLLADCFDDSSVQIATLVKAIHTTEELTNPNLPKVALSQSGKALYFSRSPIPYLRGKDITEWTQERPYFKHIGMYGYRSPILQEIARLKPTALELTESLEQLRWLDYGYSIHTQVTTLETVAIDTPEDLKKLANS